MIKMIRYYEIIVRPRFSPSYRKEFQIIQDNGHYYGICEDIKTKKNLSCNLALGDILNRFINELSDLNGFTIRFINCEVIK